MHNGSEQHMRISIIGTGYVGLVSGSCLADVGHTVTCVDIEQAKVDVINNATAPIYEDGLDELLSRNVGKRLTATMDLEAAVRESELTIIAVGTPFDGDQIDLSYIRAAAAQIGRALREKSDWHTIVVKSTVVPGTTEDVVLPILELESGKIAGVDFGVGMNPEFLREGDAVYDFMHPDRIVLGGIDVRSLSTLRDLYAPFEGVDVVETTPRTAEMIKYTSNSLLATMISFSNEIGNLCATAGNVDVKEVFDAVHLDRRLSPLLPDGSRIVPSFTTYLEAGCGFGGSCFPKDVKALIAYGKERAASMSILEAVIETNNKQPKKMLDLLFKHIPDITGKRIALLGVSFKPGSDDVRESPALPILDGLLHAGAHIQIHDPIVKSLPGMLETGGELTWHSDLTTAIRDVEAILVTARWEQYAKLPGMLQDESISPLVIDGRRMLDKTLLPNYAGIGISEPLSRTLADEDRLDRLE